MEVYQFISELEGYTPKIWRRFQVVKTISLARLAYIVMAMYEMKAYHLLAIEYERPFLTATGRQSKRMELICRYDFPDSDLDGEEDGGGDATQVRLSDMILEAPYRLVVWYDFGDDWRVSVRLEKALDVPGLSARELPRVLEGEGFGILEDCGGVCGLMDLAREFPAKGAEYEEYCAETGLRELNLAKFDLNDMNFRLKKIPGIFAKIYEQHAAHSRRAIDLIERKYLQKK